MRRPARSAPVSCLRALLACGVAATALACGGGAPPRHVVLVSIDTLRADRLGIHGAERDTSPRLDAWAREGVVFEQAMATSPWTLPSHASLLTGRFPSHHGVTTVRHALGDAVPTLAGHLAAHGFETGAVVNIGYLGERHGLDRGFGHLEVIAPDVSAEGAAGRVLERAMRWLQPRRAGRSFLFVHLFDAHSDYRSRPAFERGFGASSRRTDATSERLRAVVEGRARLGPGEADALLRLYDAGIRQLDADLAAFFAFLRDWGWLEDTLVVVTSDHGEEFLEHGGVYHGMTQYEEVLRIPLLVRGPGWPAGARVEAPVSLADVAPTIADALGLPPLPGADGTSLVGAWREGGAPGDRVLFAEAAPGILGESRRAARRGPWKLVVDRAAGERALFDLAGDPGEQRDVADANPEAAEALGAALEGLAASTRERVRAGELSPAEWSALEALGYLRGPRERGAGARPDAAGPGAP